MKRFLTPLILTLMIFTVSMQPSAAAEGDAKSTAEMKLAMRKLWEEHITYTRNYIISELAGLPDTKAVSKRLLQNQEDIGAAIKPYYGDDAGNKLTTLLKDHIIIATKVVKAAKRSDKDDLAAQQKAWNANGRDIAAFLNTANPDNWPKGDLESMLQKHLDLTTAEVTSRLKKDWTSDIKSYDEGHGHMLTFADMLTEGIAKQFPDKLSMNR